MNTIKVSFALAYEYAKKYHEVNLPSRYIFNGPTVVDMGDFKITYNHYGEEVYFVLWEKSLSHLYNFKAYHIGDKVCIEGVERTPVIGGGKVDLLSNEEDLNKASALCLQIIVGINEAYVNKEVLYEERISRKAQPSSKKKKKSSKKKVETTRVINLMAPVVKYIEPEVNSIEGDLPEPPKGKRPYNRKSGDFPRRGHPRRCPVSGGYTWVSPTICRPKNKPSEAAPPKKVYVMEEGKKKKRGRPPKKKD